MEPLPTSFVRSRVGGACAGRARAVHGPLRRRRTHRPHPGPTASPPRPSTGAVVGLRGLDLVDSGPDGERRTPVTTLRAAGQFFGVDPVAPPLWTPTTTPDLDAPLAIEADDAAALAAWFALVAGALTQVDPSAAPDPVAGALRPRHHRRRGHLRRLTRRRRARRALPLRAPAGRVRARRPHVLERALRRLAPLPPHRRAGRRRRLLHRSQRRLAAADPRESSS